MRFISQGVKDLCKNMEEHPEDWKMDSYTYKNKKNGIELWTGNGFLFLEVYNCSNFNLFEKITIRRSISKSVNNKLAKLFGENKK